MKKLEVRFGNNFIDVNRAYYRDFVYLGGLLNLYNQTIKEMNELRNRDLKADLSDFLSMINELEVEMCYLGVRMSALKDYANTKIKSIGGTA